MSNAVPMPFVVRSASGGEQEWRDVVPVGYAYQPVARHRCYFVRGDWGYIVFQVLYLAGIAVWDSQYYLRCAAVLRSGINRPFWELHRCVGSGFRADWEGIGPREAVAGRGGCCAGPYIENRVEFPAAGFYRTTDLHVDVGLLEGYAQAYPKVYDALNRMAHQRFTELPGAVFMKGELPLLYRQVYDPDCRADIRDRYLQLKAEEILLQSLEQLHPAQRRSTEKTSRRLEEIGRAAVALLEARYMEPLRAREIARLLATNEEYLRRGIRAHTGESLHGCLTRIRIERVKALLREGGRSLEAIALETGFRDADRLGKVFKQWTGVTPGRWGEG